MKCTGKERHKKETAVEITGIYKGYTRSFGFVVTPDGEDDVYIAEENRMTAMNNDKVVVHVTPGAARRRKEGTVVSVLERANETLVGTYDRQADFGFVTPDDERIHEDVYVPLDKTCDARSGARVLVRITKWPEGAHKAEGEIERVIGYDGDKDLDIKVIMARHRLPFAFPQEVLEAAEKIDKIVKAEKGLNDYRDRQLITIDGEDAKDLDDAVDAVRLENGNYRLGVYIADVSRYVKAASVIDAEAYERGTSVYLIDRVIPMLPEVLSNGICSLNAGEDRYSMTCVMEIDRNGTVVRADIGPAVIRVKRRCNYKEIKKALVDGIVPADLAPFMPMIGILREISQILRQMRLRRGAVDFDFPEYKIILDPEGRPLRLEERRRTVAEQIIEESMLIANETVSAYLESSGNPSVFRIHEIPDSDRIELMKTVLSVFNLPIPSATDAKPAEFQRLLALAKGTEAEQVVQTVALRAMQQARYATVNAGHFGLASTSYTHFTSPIRRYPDLMVHRLIRAYAKRHKYTEKVTAAKLAFLTKAAEHASVRERIAVEAERDTDDLKKAEYMKPFVGEAFTAHVTGITPFGLFVSLENGIEGLVHISLLRDDDYDFDEGTYTLNGRRGGKVYRLGDEMTVTLASVDTERCIIDFVPGKIDSLEDLQKIFAERGARRHKQAEDHRKTLPDRDRPTAKGKRKGRKGGKKNAKGMKPKEVRKSGGGRKKDKKGKRKNGR